MTKGLRTVACLQLVVLGSWSATALAKYGVVPFRGGPQVAVTPTCSNPKLTYFGGPLLQDPIIVPVFWTNTVNASIQANIGQFYADVTSSSYWAWLVEYDSVGLSGTTSEQAILGATVPTPAGYVIAPRLCPPGGNNCKLTDTDLQAELVRQIGLGVLPAPGTDCTGNANTVYMIELPHNVSLTGPDGSGTSCVNNGFCAYHNTGSYSASIPLVYGVLMDYFTGGCSAGCGGNATQLENATDVHSHELAEAATDADIGLDTQNDYANPAGWGDNNNACGEIADICDTGGAGDTITVSGRTWVVQELWSNAQGKCTSTGPAPAICSGTTVTGCRKCSCGDDGVACNGATAECETTGTNVLFGACEACTSTAGGCSSPATCQQSTTPAADDICVGACSPLTSCPAGDNCGTIGNGCGGLVTCGTGPCTSPQSCGGGGTPNVCGCTPATSCPAGDDCGTVADGCGGTITCGTGPCTSPQSCGGGGTPNVCGCTPATSCPAGDDCGTVADGCGGTIACGTGPCTSPQSCGGGGTPNVCGCTPATGCPAGDNCGTVANGCGGTITCGTGPCTSPQSCGGGGTANVCGCTPATACPSGAVCGTASNGCGGAILCGTCRADGGTPRCNGSDACVQCLTAQDCGGTTPVCNSAGTCAPCASDSDCSGATPACEPSGACGQCSASQQSQCVPPAAVCDTTTGTCVGCDSSSQCAGSSPICMNTSCVPCSATVSCPGVDGGSACVLTGQKAGQCVDCLSNTDCPTGLVCDTVSNQCVGCLANTDCNGDAPVCDVATNLCEACQSDLGSGGTASCSSALAPACQTNGSCTQCSATNLSLCPTPGQCQAPATCSASGSCNPLGSAADGTTCTGGTCQAGVCVASGSSSSGSTSGGSSSGGGTGSTSEGSAGTVGGTVGGPSSGASGGDSGTSSGGETGGSSGEASSGASTGKATTGEASSGGHSESTAGGEGTVGSSGGSSAEGTSSSAASTGSPGTASGASSGGTSSTSLVGSGQGGCNCGTSGGDPFALLGGVFGIALLKRRSRKPRPRA